MNLPEGLVHWLFRGLVHWLFGGSLMKHTCRLIFCRNPISKVINKIKEPSNTNMDLKFVCLLFNGSRKTKTKNPIEDWWPEPSQRRQKGKAKERSKDAQLARTKKGGELVPLMIGSYLIHGPFDVVSMQIMGFNNSGRSRISITCQPNPPFYSRG